MLRKIFDILTTVKILTTVGGFLFYGVHEYCRLFFSFSIFYAFAISYDDAIWKYGILFLILLGAYLLVWLISPILLRIKNRKAILVGVAGIVLLNLSDIICCLCSDWLGNGKIVSILFSALIVVLGVIRLKAEPELYCVEDL